MDDDNKILFKSRKKILYIGFNYDASYILIGTDVGFQVHQTYPLMTKFCRILNGGISFVQVLNKSNIFLLVGGGTYPKYAPNKIILWDDQLRKEKYEFRFNSFVLNCFMKEKLIFTICKDSINIISIDTLKIVKIIPMANNENGISTMSTLKSRYIISWPDIVKNSVYIQDFFKYTNLFSSKNDSLFQDKIIENVHSHEINFLKLNHNGTILATMSKTGNRIKIFDTKKGKQINELKRGTGDAKIYSLNFSFDNNFLGLTSDHGTAHIFDINQNKNEVNQSLINSSSIYEENKKREQEELEDKNVGDDFVEISKDKINEQIGDMLIIKNELISSDIFDKKVEVENRSKTFFGGMSKFIGLNKIFPTFSELSFKIPYKQQSLITFLDDDKCRNKIIVIDKEGNYILVEILVEKEKRKICMLQKGLLV